MKQETIIIRKKYNVIISIILPCIIIFFLLFVLVVNTTSLNNNLIGGFVLILILFVFLLRLIIIRIKYLLSKNPVLEINNEYIKVFDNSKFDIIPFIDILGCDVYEDKNGKVLRLYMNENTQIKSRKNRKSFEIPLEIPKVAFISITYADIYSPDLKRIIYDIIYSNNNL
ncbi:MAG: hypothetical protein RLZZ175_713 [Bacteroidota bacterium]